MNNRYIGILVGLIIIGGAAWWLLGARTASVTVPQETESTGAMMTAPTTPAASETMGHEMSAMPTVTYTNDGFSPAELTVKAGTMVNFVNQSDNPMWVASAVHPEHLLYPEFDMKRSISKGESYSFTFEKIGTHPYHNHVLLGKYGKIIVE